MLARTLTSITRILFQGKHAWLTNTVTGSALFMIGDTIQQRIEMHSNKHQRFDKDRLARIAVIGLVEGPPHYIFYSYLDRIFPGRTPLTIGKKILTDQLIACPMFSIQFFMGMAFLEGKPLRECWKEFTTKFPQVYVFDWLLWPPCQYINFYLIPNRFRLLYINTVTVGWNVFLSYMKHYDQHPLESQQKPGIPPTVTTQPKS